MERADSTPFATQFRIPTVRNFPKMPKQKKKSSEKSINHHNLLEPRMAYTPLRLMDSMESWLVNGIYVYLICDQTLLLIKHLKGFAQCPSRETRVAPRRRKIKHVWSVLIDTIRLLSITERSRHIISNLLDGAIRRRWLGLWLYN